MVESRIPTRYAAERRSRDGRCQGRSIVFFSLDNRQAMTLLRFIFHLTLVVYLANAFAPHTSRSDVCVASTTALFSGRSNTPDEPHSIGIGGSDRRSILSGAAVTMGAVLLSGNPGLASAAAAKSRTEGYEVQRSEREWAYVLSGPQYNILRQGGTERPNSSILEGEDRDGIFVCAGCGTPLFESSAKFHSGTGWPSFATALPGVEVEDVNPVQMSLAGAELRCGTCGGHLGDVFSDGKLFVNTPAFKSGKRFCIDGAALVFRPADGTKEVFGDTPPPSKTGSLPSFLEPPKITPR